MFDAKYVNDEIKTCIYLARISLHVKAYLRINKMQFSFIIFLTSVSLLYIIYLRAFFLDTIRLCKIREYSEDPHAQSRAVLKLKWRRFRSIYKQTLEQISVSSVMESL